MTPGLVRGMIPRRALLAAPALLLGGAAERVPVAAVPIARLETGWWRARHEEKMAEARSRRVDLVWLGDSITQFWEMNGPEPWQVYAPIWDRFYGDRNALNLGFGGDATSHLLWRMQNGELVGLQPKAAVVLIGANNLGRVHWNAEQTLAGIDAVVNECRKRLPTAKILLLGVMPSIRNAYVTRTTIQINRGLQERYGAGHVAGVTYMDVSGVVMTNGQVDPNLFIDIHYTPPANPLHPNPQAMTALAEAIEPTLAGMLGDRPKVRR